MEIIKLVNRTNSPLEFMFDSISYRLEPREEVPMTRQAAEHGNAKLIALLDPVTNSRLYLTGMKDIKGEEITSCDEIDYEHDPAAELIDRRNMEGADKFKRVEFNNPDARQSKNTKPKRVKDPDRPQQIVKETAQDKHQKTEENLGDPADVPEGNKDNLDRLKEVLGDGTD